jgi:hypothetical protein
MGRVEGFVLSKHEKPSVGTPIHQVGFCQGHLVGLGSLHEALLQRLEREIERVLIVQLQ